MPCETPNFQRLGRWLCCLLNFRLAEMGFSSNGQGMVAHVLASLAAAGAVVLAYGLLLIVQPHPWWDAQHSLPILAMLLGITISAVSAGLSAALKDLVQGGHPPPFPCPSVKLVHGINSFSYPCVIC